MLRRVCVFCGSKAGTDPAYERAARQLGRLLAERGIGLVYGGGSVGLMGAIADAVLELGGEVQGVIPDVLAQSEVMHPRVSQMHVVRSMHVRKALMAELSDAFITLPGGFGTFEEFFEVVTWAQLGIHNKPIGLANIAGYYDPLLAMLAHAVEHGFLHPKHRALMRVHAELNALLDDLATFQPQVERMGMTPEKT